MMSTLTTCGLFFNIVSPANYKLLPSVLQRLDSRGIEGLILILEKVFNCRYDLIIGPILPPNQACVFLGGSCWITYSSQMVPNQESMSGNQPVQSHSHAQQPLQPQSIALWGKGTPSVSFPGRSRNVSSAALESPELLIQ